ncbi:DNA polymerase delta subunit 3 [Anastrepha ludens]|uniref:DNA polymerase delta subunit 3 n=1 Tax=Anastrepha ludens TaxID=28586 RepID=UPI0023B1BC14|nr:DNA polymerase delta subunit 3 [Anastrepha ludens]
MCAAKLKEALNDCLINFDCRVLLTDLINEYHMPIEEVSSILTDYLSRQEKEGVKYVKRYVVHGAEAGDSNKEIFKIVQGESKLDEWLNKLKDSESSLYSVEVAGGAKAPAEDLKPVAWCAIKLENLEVRESRPKHINGNTANTTNVSAAVKVDTKKETKSVKGIAGAFAKTEPNISKTDAVSHAGASTSKISSEDNKKVSPQNSKSKNDEDVKKMSQKSNEQKKLSPKDKKTAAVASGQKGIGNFFAPKGKDAPTSLNKTETAVVREKSPKKLNDFFKKQADKPTTSKEAPKKAEKKSNTSKEASKKAEEKSNTSVQLFSEDEDVEDKKIIEKKEKMVEVLVESSDEEEELNKMRRRVEETDKEEAATSSRKRLRIEDSDDEDAEDEDNKQPQKKQEKLDEAVSADVQDSPPKSETYLDEDGFVITVKSKKPSSKPKATTSSRQKTPAKTSPKESKPKQTPAAAPKTKQGNIMSFFKKK